MSGESIDRRVTSLSFDNKQFEAAVKETLSTIKTLEKSLKLDGAAKGITDVGAAANKLSLSNMGNEADKVRSKFSAMSVVAITAIASLTTKVLSSAQQIASGFTIDPLKQGFEEYETQLGSIQTILSNTAASGTTLKQVNATLAELNTYSDQTIYNFAEMAKNIGTFTAAGVDLKTATASIKGIANLAALSGSNSQQASTAMYQLSQAISAGRVSLEDWNSVVNAGMGGTVFQRALALTAEKVGTLDKGAVKLTGNMKNVTIGGKSFRESITAKPGEQSWLTSDVLTKTLAQFTGDLSDAALAAQGFNKAEIKAIQSQAKMAKNAATQVKTLSQLLGTLKESAGSGWAQTWQTIFGDFNEARTLFTNVNNTLGKFISSSANARNKVLADWKALGGRTVVIQAIANSFKALISFVTPIKQAFREIFPAKTGRDLYNLSVLIRDFTKGLILGSETANKLRRTMAGFFAIFGIGYEVIKQLVGVLFDVFSTATDGSGSFLNVTASVGDFLVKLHEAVKNGEGFKKFFKDLATVLKGPIKLIRLLARAISSAFSEGGAASDAVDSLQARLEPFGALASALGKAWDKAGAILSHVFKLIEPMISQISGEFSGLATALANSISSADFSGFLDAINTGLFGALVVIIRKFLKGGIGDIGGGFLEKITGPFEELTGTLKTMQTQLKANTLVKIATAIGLLTASVLVLSLIDSDKLNKSLGALTIMFTQLLGAMALFSLATANAGALKLTTLSFGLIALSVAIGLLTVSVLALSRLDWTDLSKGLSGVLVLLIGVAAASRLMDASSGSILRTGASLVLLAAAVRILVGAVKDLSDMDWKDMAKGLVGVGTLIGSLTLFTRFAALEKGGIRSGAGILLLAGGIKILASALKDISGLSWSELARGLAGMAGALVSIGAALALMPPSSILSANAVLVVSGSLLILYKALDQMSGMSWTEIGKGLSTLAGALGIVAIALSTMTGALPGAAALLVVTAALWVFVPVLKELAALSFTEIATGLGVLAAAFLTIGLAAAVLAPVVPAILGLGAGIALVGVGMAAAGAGVLLFATALTALAVAGTAGAAALIGFVAILLKGVPTLVGLVGDIVISFAKMIEKTAPAVASAAVALITAILSAIVKIAPRILNAGGQLLLDFLKTLKKYLPSLISLGADLIISVLNGIARKAPGIVTAATNLLLAFLEGVENNLPRIIQAGIDLIISFINGLAQGIRDNSGRLGAAGANLGTAIIQGMVSGLASGAGTVAKQAQSVAQGAINAARFALGINSPSKEFIKIGQSINEGFVKGMKGNAQDVWHTFDVMRSQLKAQIDLTTKRAADLEAKLKKLNSAKKKDVSAINATTKALAQARIERSLSGRALAYMNSQLGDERARLVQLANGYHTVVTRLDAANQSLADAIKTRDDYNASVKTQYSDLPDISADTGVDDYLENLRKQIVETKAFTNILQRLRALGLNDDVYKDLLAKGTTALPFAASLLDRGKTGVAEVNQLDKSLVDAAGKLGSNASTALYQAGVDAAKGLVDGLVRQRAAIDKEMARIAQNMANGIKRALGIKSPSKVFAEIGHYSMEGLIDGLTKGAAAVDETTAQIGQDAVEKLRKAMANVSLDISHDTKPVITPVMDLSQVSKDAAKIGSLIPKSTLSVGTSYEQAKTALYNIDARLASELGTGRGPQPPRELSFTQNNYSPKALSPADIYRQTKNQISVAKGALNS